MKRYLLPLLLAVAFLFGSLNKANAAAAETITNISSTSAITTAALTTSQLNGVVYAMSVANTNATAGTLTGATFTSAGSAPNATTTTYTVYYQTQAQGATFIPGTATPAGTLAAPTTANASLVFTTFTTTIPLASGKTTYVFLVENISIPNTAGGIRFGYGGVTTTATITPPATLLGTAYTWNAATTVTLNSFNTAGANGLAYNPLYASETVVPVYGFSLTAGATGMTATFPQFVLHEAAGTIYNSINATLTLWSSPTSTFSAATATSLATYNTINGDTYGTFNLGTPLSIAAGSGTTYYFVTDDAPYAGQATTELDYSSACGTITPGSPTTGYNYTLSATPTVTSTNNTAGLSPAAGSTIYNPTSNVAAASMQLKTSASTVVLTKMTFTLTPTNTTYNNFFTTPTLYSSTSATFSTGTATAITTAVVSYPTTTTITFTIPNSVSAASTASIGTGGTYFFLVFNYTGAGTTPQTFTFAATSYTTSKSATLASPNYAGNTYICGTPGPFVLTLTSLTNAVNTDGLSNSPVAYGSTNYAVYGFSLAGSGSVAGTSTISSFTFNQNGTSTDADNLYYTTAYLYSCTTNNYTTGTKTLVATTTSDGTSTIVFTPSTAITANNSTNTYYFIVLSNTLGDANTNTFRLGYTSSSVTGTAITPATGTPGVVGPYYTFKPVPPTTVTFNSVGASGGAPTNGLTADPISTFQTGMALYGFTLAGSGTGTNETVTSLTFTRGDGDIENNNDFFPTLTLYSSTNPNFPGVGGAGVSAALGSVTLGANQNNFTITPTSGSLTVMPSTTPVYYFLVADYTTLGNYSGDTYEIDAYAVTTGSGASVNVGTGSIYGWDYTFTPPTITATDITAGLSPVPPAFIYQGQSNLAVAGIGLSVSMGSTPLTSLVFSDSQNRATAALYFNATPQLYVSTSPVFSLTTGTVATLVTATPTIATGGNVTFAITGQNITTTTLYYYMVLNYSVTGGAVPKVFAFAPSNYTVTSNGGGQGTGFATNSYTCSPPVYVSAASTNGFPPATLANSQTDIPILGFGITCQNSTTFSTFNFTTTESAGSVGTYFYNVRLYSSTTNDFTTATQVTDPGLTVSALTGANFNISGLTETVPANSTVYYFVVVNYTAPNPGPQTFTPTLASVVSSSPTATTYSTAANGLTIVGTTYTMKTIISYTYYWWGAGATADWRDPGNWTTSTTGSGANAGAYPGVFATDNAVASYDYWQSASNGQSATLSGYNITINNFSVLAGYINYTGRSTFNLTVNSADSLTVASLTIGTTSSARAGALNILGSASGGVISSLRVTGATNLIYNATLTASTNGIINFPTSSSSITYTGTTATTYVPTLAVAGGLINTKGNTFSFATGANYGGLISVSSGNLSTNGSTINMTGLLPEIQSSGGTSNFNTTTINVTGTNTAGYVTGFAVSGGTVNINGTSTTPSVINLGTAANNGINSEVYTSGGVFNLGAYSTLNIIGVNSSSTYYNFQNAGGVVTCASTSTINPTSSNAWIYNGSNGGASNYFTFLSDANGTATIGPLGSAARITGKYNYQRYISTASRNYRLLASQVNVTNYISGNATTPNLVNLYALSQSATVPTTPVVNYPGAWVGGPAGTGSGFTAATGGPCLYLYQECIVPSTTYFDKTYYAGKNIAVTSLSNPYLSTQSTAIALGGTGANAESTAADNGTNNIEVPAGNGYLLYYIGNNANTVSAPVNTTATTGSGYINQGTIPFVLWGAAGNTTSALTNNGVSQTTNPHAFAGLTMVGNPYPSSIDVQKIYTDNISAASIFTNGTYGFFNTLDPVTEQFSSYGYNGSSATFSGSNPQRYIASGQGFYVTVVNAGKTLTFYEDQKTTTNPPTVLESIPVTNPLATVDNVSPGNNKIADALATATQTGNAANTSNAATVTDIAALNTKKLNDATTNANTAVSAFSTMKLNAAKKDTTNGKKVRWVAAPVASVAAPASTNTTVASTSGTTTPIAGLHLKFVVDTINNDEVGIYFTPKGSDKFEGNDAIDMDGQSGKVYLSSYTSDGLRTSINSLGNYTGGKRVKLFAKAYAAGIYKMQMSDINNIDTADYSVFLIDNLKADSLDLTLYKSYNFNYAPGTANDSTRFVLAIEHKPVPYYALLTFAGQKVTQGVQLNWTVKNEFNTTKFVVQKLEAGNTYASLDALSSDNSSLYSFVDQHPSIGNNTYRLQQTTALGVITYSAPVTIGYNSTSPNGGLNVYPNPAKTQITVTLSTSSLATQVATADIYNTSGTLIEHKAVNSNSFTHDVSSYQLGVYIIELKNSNGLLIGKSKFVKVQ